MKQITAVLADDHMLVREGLKILLEREGDIKVVAQAKTGREAVELAKKFTPDVVVMDIGMPLLNGLEATRQIVKATPATKVIILSAHAEEEYIRQATVMGAAGYLVKDTTLTLLANIIRDVHKGKTFLSHPIFRSREWTNQPGHFRKRNINLTSREIEVLQLIAEGKANKQTADELGISIKTVEKHRQNLMKKLDIHDTAGLTRYAISSGVIESNVLLTIVK